MPRVILSLFVVFALAAIAIFVGVEPDASAFASPAELVTVDWAAVGAGQKADPMPLPWLVALLQAFLGLFAASVFFKRR